jgi:hypothetical protein
VVHISLKFGGAEGGSSSRSGSVEGEGGYSAGNITLTAGQQIFVYVRGAGERAGSASMPNPSGGTMIGKSDNGYARITYIP